MVTPARLARHTPHSLARGQRNRSNALAGCYRPGVLLGHTAVRWGRVGLTGIWLFGCAGHGRGIGGSEFMPCSAPPALRPLKSCDVITLRHGSQAGSHDAVDLCAPQRPDEIERQVLERSSRAAPCDAQAAGDCPQAGEYLGGAVVW